MAKMKASTLIAYFERMLGERWAYRWGAAEEGAVDCSGAFVWALGQEGIVIYHGSNRMARTEVNALLPVSEARPGMMAFKRRREDESGYALPREYREGENRYNGDLHDYYHVGLVDRDAGFVLNAQSTRTGFVRSRITEGWDCVGYCKEVDYEGDDKMNETVTGLGRVTADSGGTVNLRRSASRMAAVIKRVPVGSTVRVLSREGDWYRVSFEGNDGYMMAEFIALETPDGENAPCGRVHAYLERALESIDALRQSLEEALGEIRGR